MNDPIIIQTERVAYPHMTDREKQIYDEAYRRGVEYGKAVAKNKPIENLVLIAFVALLILIAFALS